VKQAACADMKKKPGSAGLILSIIGLGILLVISGYGVILALKIGGISHITVHGWVAMGLAIVFTALLTGGLIWLAFYSNSHGYDD
jgi:hypothetical protein